MEVFSNNTNTPIYNAPVPQILRCGCTIPIHRPVVERHVDLVVKAAGRRTESDLEQSAAAVVGLEEVRNAKAGLRGTNRHFQVTGARLRSVDVEDNVA